MKTIWIAMMFVIIAGTSPANAQTPIASPESTPDLRPERVAFWECAEIDGYQDTLYSLSVEHRVNELQDLGDDDLAAMRPSELKGYADDLFDLADDMEAMTDIPKAAYSYHKLAIKQFSLLGNVLNSMATAGLFGALPYVDVLNSNSDAMGRAWDAAFARCGHFWSDEFPDRPESSDAL